MKLLFIIEAWDPFYAGGQVHCKELCKILVEEYNCNITLLTRRLKVEGKKYNKNEEHYTGKLKIVRSGFTTRYESIIGRISWVISVFLSNLFKRYSIIHGQANLGGLPTWMLGLFKRSKTVFTVHGSGLLEWDEMEKGMKARINEWIERFLQTKLKYDAEISVDSRFAEFKNKNKPIIIPNGVDIEKFDKINIKKESKFKKILFVGRLHPQKGLKYLIEALSLIKDKIKNTEVHIIGGGEQEAQLKKLSGKFSLKKIIKFRGKIFADDLIREYKSSHLFILPSIFEGQPLTLLEAWAAKLPVIVTDVGDNSKFVEDRINGWIIEPKKPKKLAETILKALDSDMINIGEKGYKLVKESYSWEEMVRKTYKIYKELLK